MKLDVFFLSCLLVAVAVVATSALVKLEALVITIFLPRKQ